MVLCRGGTDVHCPGALSQMLAVLSPPGTSERGSHAAPLVFSPPGCLSHGKSGCGTEHCGMLGGLSRAGADRRTLRAVPTLLI